MCLPFGLVACVDVVLHRDCPSRRSLSSVLRNVADPCDRSGACHSLFTVRSLLATGTLTGCRYLTTLWEHVTDLTSADLEALRLEAGHALPSEPTIRRVLQDLDPTEVKSLVVV